MIVKGFLRSKTIDALSVLFALQIYSGVCFDFTTVAIVATSLSPCIVSAESSGLDEPLYPKINEIVLCSNDAEAKIRFGHPKLSGLSSGAVWCYVGKDLRSFPFTDKAERGGDWYTLISDDSLYEVVPKGLPSEKTVPYCRIWHFDRKPGTLYWVMGQTGAAEFEIKPPHGTRCVNLAERLFGPDGRAMSQWYAAFGKIMCQARAGDTNRVDWQFVYSDAFSPADFIDKCRVMYKGQLERELDAAKGELISSRDNEGRLRRLKAERDVLQKELDRYVEKAENAFKEATRELENAKVYLADARNEQSLYQARMRCIDAVTKAQKAKRELDEAKRLRDKKDANGLFSRVQSLDEEIMRIEKIPEMAQARVRMLEDEIKALPSVEEARRQWTIHVKVDLGGGK